MRFKRCTRPVNSARNPFDVVSGGLAGADSLHEFLLDAGDVAVKDGLGPRTKGFEGVFLQADVIVKRLLPIDLAELFPV